MSKKILFSIISLFIAIIALYTKNMQIAHIAFVLLIISVVMLLIKSNEEDNKPKTKYPTICPHCNKLITNK